MRRDPSSPVRARAREGADLRDDGPVVAPSPDLGRGPLGVLRTRIAQRTATVGVVGLGYVGLPLSMEIASHFPVVGVDIDLRTVVALERGLSHIGDVPSHRLAATLAAGRFSAAASYQVISECDVVVICVPTPLDATGDPDMSSVAGATAGIAAQLRPGQLVVVESTTYPGATDEVVLPALAATGLQLDVDFLVAFSPERVDPGNTRFELREITKVVGGTSPLSTTVAADFYEAVFERVHIVSSARAAEMTKLLENSFRLVNIALVDEIAVVCRRLGIDTSEVVAAAATKPFGFTAFSPGPGIGGHCIPVDPFYLSWAAARHGVEARMVEAAGKVARAMPAHVVDIVGEELDRRGVSLDGSRILVVGAAYKEDIADTRNSPALDVMALLMAGGATVAYHDPYVPSLCVPRRPHGPGRPTPGRWPVPGDPGGAGGPGVQVTAGEDPVRLHSVALTEEEITRSACVVVMTAHRLVDTADLLAHGSLVVDTRNSLDPKKVRTARASVVRL